MMKPALICMAFCLAAVSGFAQSSVPKKIRVASPPSVADQIRAVNPAALSLSPLRFLASDELMGRGTTRPEIHIAASYIAEQFRSFGLKELPEAKDYLQSFELKLATPASSGALVINGTTYSYGKDLLQAGGNDVSLQAPVVFAGYGSKDDLDKIDVKGAIVVTNMGLNDSSSFREGFRAMATKRRLAAERGAVALVERVKDPGTIWQQLQHRYEEGQLVRDAPTVSLPLFMLNDGTTGIVALVKDGTTASLTTTGNRVNTLAARNVVGVVEGTDPKLKDQYVVLSAHYDHVGVARQPKMEEGKLDSIYNGARDNAIGATAVINAARYFAQYPPKRSVLFVAYTGEEMGLIGSSYFAAHPPLPLNKMVYNLNIDNASYNDTTIVTVVGLGRTSADDDIKRGAAAFGLTAISDPSPEQGLFDRSDNVNLAAKGIPAPTYSLGFRSFDEEIMKRYHQLSDEVGNFNLSYATKYMNSFVLAAKYIADNAAQPVWKKGDKYEGAWKALYHKNP